ncbi:hypothetical protein WB401_09875 [Streptomyces brasiliscabiei]|uniref:Uncharacterized protein n=1 Tax=Streptomyces brasiliscabiei TaxID=2736302 RepID=A0ABU8GIW4_9ACTN
MIIDTRAYARRPARRCAATQAVTGVRIGVPLVTTAGMEEGSAALAEGTLPPTGAWGAAPSSRSRCRPDERTEPTGRLMCVATKEQYEKVILKAEIQGLNALSKHEVDMLRRLAQQAGAMGNRVRNLLK